MSNASATCFMCKKKFSFLQIQRHPFALRKCGHSFCGQCMVKITEPVNTDKISCPLCKVKVGVIGTESAKYVCVLNKAMFNVLTKPPSFTGCFKCNLEYGPEREPYFISIHSKRKDCGHSACLSCIDEMRTERKMTCEECATFVKLPGKNFSPIKNVSFQQAMEYVKSSSTPETRKRNYIKFLEKESTFFTDFTMDLMFFRDEYLTEHTPTGLGTRFVSMMNILDENLDNEQTLIYRDRKIIMMHYPKIDYMGISQHEDLSERLIAKILGIQARLEEFMVLNGARIDAMLLPPESQTPIGIPSL